MRDGLVVVDKPASWTSHDVVAKLRRVYGQRRVGHAGTLDPDATGVLVVGLGRATRLLRFVQETTKRYEGTVVFGVATDTLDASGAVLEREPVELTRAEVEVAAARFVGDLLQVPPMVSAVKVGGRRLYELAREGGGVERAPRRVHVDALTIVGFDPGPYPAVDLEVTCSSGTYVRSLAADLGGALGTVAHLARLRRLAVGRFTIEGASSVDALERDPDAAVRAPREAVADLPFVEVDDQRARAVGHGAVFPARDLGGDVEGADVVAVVDAAGELLAVYERRGAGMKPAVVLASAPASG